jgi:hypothetical protein
VLPAHQQCLPTSNTSNTSSSSSRAPVLQRLSPGLYQPPLQQLPQLTLLPLLLVVLAVLLALLLVAHCRV